LIRYRSPLPARGFNLAATSLESDWAPARRPLDSYCEVVEGGNIDEGDTLAIGEHRFGT
jgi:hypothetical protein